MKCSQGVSKFYVYCIESDSELKNADLEELFESETVSRRQFSCKMIFDDHEQINSIFMSLLKHLKVLLECIDLINPWCSLCD